jgi:UrcA family protein
VAKQYTVAALAVFALMSGPALARAAQPDPDAAAQAKVSYADLDLSTAKGQAVLADRIHRAAKAVCGEEPDLRDMDQSLIYRRCMKQTEAQAFASIPGAAQAAKGRVGGPAPSQLAAPR